MLTNKKVTESIILNLNKIKNLKYYCNCNYDICYCNELLKYNNNRNYKKITKNQSNKNFNYLLNQWKFQN